MRKQRVFQLILTVGLVGGLVSKASSSGDSGMLFLRIGVGARATAMANAHTAVVKGQSACYWNPAGLVGIRGKSALFMHTWWLQGTRYEYGGIASGDGKAAWGVSFAYNSSGQLELRTKPTPKPEGSFSMHDLMLAFSYAHPVTPHLNLGITGKLLYEKIYIEDASGVAFDLGVLYHTPLSHLNWGLSLRNIGKVNKLRQETIKLPRVAQLGLSYQFHLLGGNIVACLDLELPRDSVNSLHFGAEYQLNRFLSLRAGYQTGYQERNVAAGLGFRIGDWQIDYAYVPYYFDLGNTHRISVEFE